jgi:hypothetical protein
VILSLAMTDAEQPVSEPVELRELAKQLRRLADQSLFPDIEAGLLDLAARFERMAADLEGVAKARLGRKAKPSRHIGVRCCRGGN